MMTYEKHNRDAHGFHRTNANPVQAGEQHRHLWPTCPFVAASAGAIAAKKKMPEAKKK